MNGTYAFPVAKGQKLQKGDFVTINTQGEIVPADPDNPNAVGIAIEAEEYKGNGQDNRCLVSLHNLSNQGPITLYAPKNPIPYENLEFEFDLKTGKPKTPIFELVFGGIVQTFREIPIKSHQYRYCEDADYLRYPPPDPSEPTEFHNYTAIANYQYNCTLFQYDDDERYSLIHRILMHRIDQHYELLLCIIGKNTYVFQEAHIQGERHFGTQSSQSYTFTIYVDKREFILHEEALQEKTDPRFNIELGECDRSLPPGKYDIEI